MGHGTFPLRMGAAVGVFACVTFVSLSSVAAVITLGSLVITAPYNGATWSSNTQILYSCATSARFAVAPHWSNSTGVGGWIVKSSSKTCTLGGLGGSNGWASTILTIGLPVRIPTGAHSVQVTAKITFTPTGSIHIGKVCPAIVLNANGNGVLNCRIGYEWCFPSCFNPNPTYLLDKTNNSYTYSSTSLPAEDNYSYAYNDTSCGGFICTYSNSSGAKAVGNVPGNSVFTWYFNTTAVKTHRYLVVISINGYASSYVDNYPSSAAASSLNFDSLGNQFNVTSIKIA